MYDPDTDISDREPVIQHVCENICEAFQEGIAIWDGRVQSLLLDNARDLEAAEKLRASLEEGFKTLAKFYMKFYKQAGAHFAIGDRTYVSFRARCYVLSCCYHGRTMTDLG